MPINLRYFRQLRWKVFEVILAALLAVLVGANAMTATAAPADQAVTTAITVTVQDANSAPLGGRTVYVFDTAVPNPAYLGISGVTDSITGQVVFNLDPGAYSFASDDVNGQRYFSAACDTTTCAAATITEPVFGPVTVTVQDTNNTPLTGRRVYVFDNTSPNPVYQGLSAITDVAGQVTFNLPVAAYTFASDDVNNRRYFSAACDLAAVTPCAAATITEPVFGDVGVTVTDGVNPIANQRVYVFDAAGPPYTYQNLSGFTDASGVVTFTLPVSTNGYVFGTDDVNNVRHFSTGACIVTGCNSATIEMPVYGDVGVLVTNGTTPIANQLVYVFDAAGPPYAYLNLSGLTDASGVVTFTLPVTANGYVFGTDDVNSVRHFSPSACIVTGCSSATIELPVYGDVAVTVSNANGPLGGRLVYVFDAGGPPYTYQNLSGVTDPSGVVTFTLPANTNGYVFGTDDVNQVRRFSTPACSVPGCTTAAIVEPLYGTVQVTVSTANGPLANQTVYVFDGTRATYQNLQAVTGPNGEPALFTLPEGGYSFRADANNVQYWSAPPVCTVLGCSSASIVEPVGSAGAVTVDLCATTGALDLPGLAGVPIFGYKPGDCTDSAPAQLPGPTLNFVAGDDVTVRLHNGLGESTALLFQGQAMIPDLTGVANGGVKEYHFTAKAGTYLYEAGLLDNAASQVAMGLYGAMVVRPAGTLNQAYAAPVVNYDSEAVVLLSEIDPALNAAPSTFDMRDYAPKFSLINGQPGPLTGAFNALSGQKLLLRYVNAGLHPHSMSVLGLRQSAVAMDGNAFAHAKSLVAETIAPGETADMVVTIPANAADGSKFALYDGSFTLDNNGTGLGGMMTFVEVGVAAVNPNDVTGPAVTAVALLAANTNGSADVQIAANIDDSATGGSNVIAAEYFIDAIGIDGNGTAMSIGVGGLPNATGVVPVAVLAGLPSGKHTIYVHGQDGAGNWGHTNYAVLNLDKSGPATTGLVLSPNPSNGSVAVTLSATADDQMTGNNAIVAAEYQIDNNSVAAMNVNVPASVASLVAVIPTTDLGGLTDGAHVVAVRARDALGNWGAWTATTLLVDQSAPDTVSVSISPDTPNNGTIPVNSSQLAVRVDAEITDVGANLAAVNPVAPVLQAPVAAAAHLYLPAVTNSSGNAADAGVTTAAVKPNTSYVKRAEGFIDSVGANGSGFPLMATDSVFDQGTENAYAFIPLSTIALLSSGTHSIYVHGMDGAGNWGSVGSASLIIDKDAPLVSNLAASNNPTNSGASNNVSFVLSATATDTAGVARAEWFTGADPGAGNGTAMAVNGTGPWGLSATIDFMALGWSAGPRTIFVRAQDTLGNAWSLPQSISVDIQLPNFIFADSFESGNFSAWTSVQNGGNSFRVTTGNASDGTSKMQATNVGTTRYVTYQMPANETSYRARFFFNPNGVTGNNVTREVFRGLNGNATIFSISVRRQSGAYQVGATVNRAGGSTQTNWYTIPTPGYTAIEFAWNSGNPATFSLSTDGVVRQTLNGLNTSASTLTSVQFGPRGDTLGSTWYFDNFVSARRILP